MELLLSKLNIDFNNTFALSALAKKQILTCFTDQALYLSFIPEIFLGLAIILILMRYLMVIQNWKYNYPILTQEVYYQTFLILVIYFFLLQWCSINGQLSTDTLVNDVSIRVAKQTFILFTIIALVPIADGYKLLKLNFSEYFILILTSILALTLMLNCTDFLTFYLLIELQSLCFYGLVAINRKSLFSIEAALKYFIVGSCMSGIYLLGVYFIYQTFGTVTFQGLTMILMNCPSNLSTTLPILVVSSACITGYLFFKLAAFPFYQWAGDVYAGAPISTTILLSILPKIPTSYFLMKWVYCISFFNEKLLFLVIIYGIVGFIHATYLTLGQKRFKRFIIFSSLTHLIFIFLGIATVSLRGYAYAFFYLDIYILSLTALWMFYLIFSYGSAQSNLYYKSNAIAFYYSSLSNFLKENSKMGITFLILMFSIAGIPPFCGFLAKMYILFNLLKANTIFFAVMIMVASSVPVFYYILLLKTISFEPQKDNKEKINHYQTIYDTNSIDIMVILITTVVLFLIVAFFEPNFVLLLSYLSVYGTILF